MGMAYLPVSILLLLSSFCKSDDQLTHARPLSPGDMLISKGGVFALGFFSPTSSNRSLYLGIWYHSIPGRTVVWIANRDNPIITPSSTKLVITNSSDLALSDSQGRTLWATMNNITAGGAGASAVLLNTGNLVLQLPNGRDIWQSFDHPTDTILPGMRFLLSYKSRVVGRLVAWKGPNDPSAGDFSYSLDPSSNLQVVIWNGTRPYYRMGVWSGVSVYGGIYQSNTGSITYVTVAYMRDEFYFMYTVSAGSPCTFMKLDYTGMLRSLSWSNQSSSWTVFAERPQAGSCELYASCGPFGYCDFTGAVPMCQCLDGFEPDFPRGCRRTEALKCGKENHFVAMDGMMVPDKFLHVKNRSFDQCAAECSRNCSCTGYAYANLSRSGAMADPSRCLVWTGELVDASKIGNAGETLYLRLADSPDRLTQVLDAERESPREFQSLPSHYIKISKLLFDHACDDISDAYLVRSLIEDIRDVRFHKVETGLEIISGRTHAVKKVDKVLRHKVDEQFFDIDPICEEWVLASAGKKWRDFKNTLKKKYYKEEISAEENIANGCGDRIPPPDWKWLVEHWSKEETKTKAKRNAGIRATQENALHTCGSQSFAVLNNGLERLLGREPCRAESYLATHKKKNGEAISAACKEKIDEIEKRFAEDETLRFKSVDDGDLYDDVLPQDRKGRVCGMGLLPGGSKAITLSKAVATLKQVEEENAQLRSMVANTERQFAAYKECSEKRFEACKERQDKQYEDLKSMLLILQGASNSENREQAREITQPNVQLESNLEKDTSSGRGRLLESSSSENRIDGVLPSRTNKVLARKHQKVAGREVALRNLGGSNIVAHGRLQCTEKTAVGVDGLALGAFYEILIDVVIDKNVLLPRPLRKASKLGAAIGLCIAWPYHSVLERDGSPLNLIKRSLDFCTKT